MQVRVAIVDDHVMVREGIKQLLEMDGDIVVVGEAGDGEEGIRVMEACNPDVLLLDINMPKMNGLEVLEYIKNSGVKRKVLVLTIHNEVEYMVKAMEIGASGYVLKDSDLSVLRQAIFSVYEGKPFAPASLLQQQFMMEQASEEEQAEPLTKREMEVLKLIAEGLYNKEIANRLEISEKTVKNHVSNIFRKIHVSDRTQAAVYAIKNGYVIL